MAGSTKLEQHLKKQQGESAEKHDNDDDDDSNGSYYETGSTLSIGSVDEGRSSNHPTSTSPASISSVVQSQKLTPEEKIQLFPAPPLPDDNNGHSDEKDDDPLPASWSKLGIKNFEPLNPTSRNKTNFGGKKIVPIIQPKQITNHEEPSSTRSPLYFSPTTLPEDSIVVDFSPQQQVRASTSTTRHYTNSTSPARPYGYSNWASLFEVSQQAAIEKQAQQEQQNVFDPYFEKKSPPQSSLPMSPAEKRKARLRHHLLVEAQKNRTSQRPFAMGHYHHDEYYGNDNNAARHHDLTSPDDFFKDEENETPNVIGKIIRQPRRMLSLVSLVSSVSNSSSTHRRVEPYFSLSCMTASDDDDRKPAAILKHPMLLEDATIETTTVEDEKILSVSFPGSRTQSSSVSTEPTSSTTRGDEEESMISKHLFVPEVRSFSCNGNTSRCIGLLALLCLFLGSAIGLSVVKARKAGQMPTRLGAPTGSPVALNKNDWENTVPQVLKEFSSLQDLEQMDSPQRRAMMWLIHQDQYYFSSTTSVVVTDRLLLQRYAVVVLFYATNGDQWTNMDNFLDPLEHECDWSSTLVSCVNDRSSISGKEDGTVRRVVRDVIMSQNQLKGSLPRELGVLTDLQRLELSDNALTGTIPTTELLGGALSSLTGLDLSQNKLTGPIVIPPVEVGLVRNELHHLNLCENKLTGVIPQALYDQPYLKTVSLCSNRFSGSISNRIQSLSFLNILDLSNNILSGTIPSLDSSKLRYIWLDRNFFTGTLALKRKSVGRLEELTLSHNRLTGSLGDYFGMLESNPIRRIDWGFNSLSGTMPEKLNEMSTLETLVLSSNKLTGTLAKFPSNIKHIELNDNNLVGGIDGDSLNLRNLEFLSMSKTTIGGSIPSQIQAAPNLKFLNLSHCNLTGSIPSKIGSLPNLEYLILKGNMISSSIPADIGNLETLLELNLDDNDLSKDIPDSFQQFRELKILTVKNNKLTGTIPVTLSSMDSLMKLDLTGNLFRGSVPEEVCDLRKFQMLQAVRVGCHIQCTCCYEDRCIKLDDPIWTTP